MQNSDSGAAGCAPGGADGPGGFPRLGGFPCGIPGSFHGPEEGPSVEEAD